MAQAPAAGPRAVTPDGGDDVKLYVAPDANPTPQNAPASTETDLTDIRELWVGEETEGDFRVSLQMKALPTEDSWRLTRLINFDLGGVKYQIQTPFRGAPSPNHGQLQYYDEASQRFRGMGESGVLAPVVEGTTIVYTLDRGLVTNKEHVPARYGDTLNNVSATATQTIVRGFWFIPTPGGGVYLEDKAPDTGVGTPYTMIKGRTGEGEVFLHSNDPIRVSNGESTTIVYKVDVMNHGTKHHKVQLEATGLENGWTVRVPSILDLQPSDTVTVPVILSLPFTHSHGQTATFELRASSINVAGTWSKIDLGVYWTETPQPAGHHNKMWIHSTPLDFDWTGTGASELLLPFRSIWMNPSSPDPEQPDDGNVPAFVNNELAQFLFSDQHTPPPGTTWTTGWWIPMSPGLLIGLDFDMKGEATFATSILHKTPAQTSTLTATLMHCDPTGTPNEAICGSSDRRGPNLENWKTLATGRSAAKSASANALTTYEVPLTLDPRADLLEYKHGANVALRLLLTTDLPANGFLVEPRPELVIKEDASLLTLPLIEYHDPIDQFFQNVGSLKLDSLVGFEKKVNPGKTTVFRFMLNNTGDAAESVRLELTGENVKWATLAGNTAFTLGPGEGRVLELVVEVPANARADSVQTVGERAELFLVAQSVADPTVVAAIRLRATVVDAPEIPDEESTLKSVKPKGSPGFGWEAVAVSLLGLYVWDRRRRAPPA